MLKRTLTGGRIRERRLDLGIKQADLARQCGISAAYLNLIEHNRRRIGGKLLIDLAQALGVEPVALSKGADAELLQALQEAAARHSGDPATLEDARDFAARFPQWAGLVAAQQARISTLERTAETLTDRLAHDPFLSETLHAVLSSATSIRSAAAILVETREIDPAWRTRFQRNLNEDAEKLADQAQRLVQYLDSATDAQSDLSAPQEELEQFLAENGWHFPELEQPGRQDAERRIDDLVAERGGWLGREATALAKRWMRCMAADARALPAGEFSAAMQAMACNPAALAEAFECDPARVMRRMACLPAQPAAEAGPPSPFGLLVCDGAGALVFRKPVAGFSLPRFGAGCPRWPLFQALNTPAAILRRLVETPGEVSTRFLTYAVARPTMQGDFSGAPPMEATMLMVSLEAAKDFCAQAVPEGPDAFGPVQAVGSSCRVCPRTGCASRRELSILTEGG